MRKKVILTAILFSAVFLFSTALSAKDYPQNGPYEEHYSDGKLKLEGNFKNGLEEGVFKTYSQEGRLVSERTYKGGRSFGLQKEYYPNGELQLEWTANDSGINGVFKTYTDQGLLSSEEFYTDGNLTEIKQYDKEGRIVFYQPVRSGVTADRRYYDDGVIQKIHFCYTEDDGVHCSDQHFSRAGVLRRKIEHQDEESYVGYNYDIKGTLVAETPYQNGRMHGHVKTFYPSGEVWRDTKYIEGSAQGETLVYDKLGNIIERSLYKDSMLVWTKYYDNQGKFLKAYIPARGDVYDEEGFENIHSGEDL